VSQANCDSAQLWLRGAAARLVTRTGHQGEVDVSRRPRVRTCRLAGVPDRGGSEPPSAPRPLWDGMAPNALRTQALHSMLCPLRHAPKVAGSVMALVVNPITGSLVAAAGDAVSGRVPQAFLRQVARRGVRRLIPDADEGGRRGSQRRAGVRVAAAGPPALVAGRVVGGGSGGWWVLGSGLGDDGLPERRRTAGATTDGRNGDGLPERRRSRTGSLPVLRFDGGMSGRAAGHPTGRCRPVRRAGRGPSGAPPNRPANPSADTPAAKMSSGPVASRPAGANPSRARRDSA
jgi:hypothetical protein